MDTDEAGPCGPAAEPQAEPVHDWAAIRQAYCGGKLTLAEIEERFGVNRSSIYHRVDNERWPRRKPANRGGRSKAEQLLARLKHIVEQRITDFENLAGAEAQGNGASLERETRSLASLVKLMDKIVELETAARNARHRGATSWSAAYRDQRREELARKLIAMLERERGAPLPE